MLDWEKQVKPYLSLVGNAPRQELLHPFYQDSINHKNEILELFSLTYPKFMELTRPRESDAQKKYRKDVFQNPTLSIKERVFDYIKNIKKNADYAVKYASDAGKNQEDYNNYVKEKFNREGDLEGWMWENAVNMVSLDPNAVMAFIPIESQTETEPRKVKGKFLPCENVWMHQKAEFAVILSDDKLPMAGEVYESQYTGAIIYFFDHESYCIAKQKSKTDSTNKSVTWEILGLTSNEDGSINFNPPLHYCDGLPVRKLGKTLDKMLYSNKYELFKHELSSEFPFIRTTIKRFNDMEIEVNTATNTLHWRKKAPCNNCGGTGKVTIWENDSKVASNCQKCKGEGWSFAMSSLDVHVVSDQIGEDWKGINQAIQATAPGGSVQNAPINLMALTDQYKEQYSSVFHNKGLSSLLPIHFAQSGTAKKEDKEGAIRFGTEWANHICNNLLSWAYWCVASMRYGIAGNQLELMPDIAIPRQFNLDTKEEVGVQLKDAIVNKMDAGVIDTLQLKYLKLEAGEDSDAYKRYELRMLLDGYRGHSAEEKYLMISNEFALGDRTSEQFANKVKALYFSVNYDKIYQDAVIENYDFGHLSIQEKKLKMVEIATRYESILPADKPLESFTQRSPVNMQDRNQV